MGEPMIAWAVLLVAGWGAAVAAWLMYRSALHDLHVVTDALDRASASLIEERAYVDGLAGGRDR